MVNIRVGSGCCKRLRQPPPPPASLNDPISLPLFQDACPGPDWGRLRSCGLAALSGGISGGLAASKAFGNMISGLGKYGQIAARGATASALTQGLGVATGLQNKFSFAGVAAAGVGAIAGAGFGDRFGSSLSSGLARIGGAGFADIGTQVASGTAGGLANAATRSALNGSSFGDNFRAAIPDIIGQAVGNAVAGGIAESVNRRVDAERKARAERLEATFGEGAFEVAGPIFRAELIGAPPTRSSPLSTEDFLSVAGLSDAEVLDFQVGEVFAAAAGNYVDAVASGESLGFSTGNGYLDFGLGAGLTFTENTITGTSGLIDYIRDGIGAGLSFVQAGANALSGNQGNSFIASRGEFAASSRGIGSALGALAEPFATFGPVLGGFVLRSQIANSIRDARAISNGQETPFLRGRTNLDTQIVLNIGTAGLAFTKGSLLARGAGAIDETAGLLSSVSSADVRFLRDSGITDRALRRQIIESGFRSSILDGAPITANRFNTLFPDTFQAGKSFSGRLGNIDTRVSTLFNAATLERAGLTPRFEFQVPLGNGRSRFVDLVGLQNRQPTTLIQLVKESPTGRIIRAADEFRAAQEIENALSLPAGTVRFINTRR